MPTSIIPAAVATEVSQFLENTGGIVTSGMSWMQTVWTTITGDPILMCIVIGLPLVGVGIGLLSRLIRV